MKPYVVVVLLFLMMSQLSRNLVLAMELLIA